MTRKLSGYILAGAVIVLALAARGADAEIVLRYSQYVPSGHFSQKNVFYPYIEDIKKATDGRVIIQPTAKPLGAPRRHYQLVVDGIADLAWGLHGYTPGTFPLSEMVELPFLTRSAEANSVAYWRVFKKYFEPTGMHNGIHTLAVNVHPAGHIYNNKRNIRSIDDFRGLKIRSTNYAVSEALKIFGGIPIAAPVTKIRDGLSKGVFDGTSFTDEAVANWHIGKFVKFVTHVPGGLYNTSFFVAFNAANWKRISSTDQTKIMALSGAALARRIGRVWDQQEAAAPARLAADGVIFTTVDGAFLKGVKSKLAVIEKNWVARAKKAGVDGAAALKMFRAEVAAYGS